MVGCWHRAGRMHLGGDGGGAGLGQEIDVGIVGVGAVERQRAARQREGLAEQGEIAAHDRERAGHLGIRRRAADLEIAAPFGIEAAAAHEHAARRVDRDVEVDLDRLLGGRLGGRVDLLGRQARRR